MTRGPVNSGEPDRLYTLTGGRAPASASAFDLVTLVVGEGEPARGMQSEHIRILRMCHRPVAVVELSARLALPVGVVKVLLGDLLAAGRISARPPRSAAHGGEHRPPPPDTLKKVLRALQNL
ncbi:DUF742 domain-containing protein [Streptomyces sp. V4-01]|uniref:DUF742 domain-containing protein n=1 Tax=Actinacidiphila polyblastidii TaxID=3110430 RepID=A0ABU7PHQ4_9ACTN|nr:DUF742 domain-containing protein [Streptomyces sp. V4-01]